MILQKISVTGTQPLWWSVSNVGNTTLWIYQPS